MRFAVPMAQGKMSLHFGHCESFALISVEDGKVTGREDVQPPAHEPGALPRFLAARGVNVVIAGGMGRRAIGLFGENGIEVVVGAARKEPEDLVRDYLAGTLESTGNICDH